MGEELVGEELVGEELVGRELVEELVGARVGGGKSWWGQELVSEK